MTSILHFFLTENTFNLFREAEILWGLNTQLVILMEECGELIQSASKYIRYGDERRDELINEMADVYIMLAQMSVMLDINDEEFGNAIGKKIDIIKKKIK